MDAVLEKLLWDRAANRCEYCLIHKDDDILPFHVDHIIAKQHGGLTNASNLAIACYSCNLHKGTNLSGRDPKTRRIVRLFHPRRNRWSRHFHFQGPMIVGRTAIGRATVTTLAINIRHRVALRELLIVEGLGFDIDLK